MPDHLPAELRQIIQGRRSIRSFGDQVPTASQIQELLDAARFAPSGVNFQPWFFIVITAEACKQAMAGAVAEKLQSWQAAEESRLPRGYTPRHFLFFEEAPVVIAVLYKPYPASAGLVHNREENVDTWRHAVAIQSAAAAVQNLLLAAHALGLGGCWMDNPLIARRELEVILGVRQPWNLLALVPIGTPAAVPAAPRRKPIEAISRFVANSESGGQWP